MKGHMPLQRPITLNMGMRMNGWFDLTSLDKINADEDELGLRESIEVSLNPNITDLITRATLLSKRGCCHQLIIYTESLLYTSSS